MAIVYFDASALVKLCLPEPGSALASALFNRADLAVTSRIADVEVRAALAAGERAGLLDAAGHADAVAAWERLWPAMHVVEMGDQVVRAAADLVASSPVPLRAGDAMHVASALTVAHPETVVAAWDEHVAGAARARALTVLP
ncbi:VapC toxin family PIN domain ribonuclease [Xylanimonas oleitrophica]|uniref:Ribonuclease VapC n=1 Tax=Xylanimonas oleitrophica TaxID=2607479 RepID=A0A2W5YC41_9MICO|nr:type II toxin-antitoxin system VapC family toxin [Xylanimonas oleitrophica]PZR51651.1 VapC toxin family PIN domain ribonuclease [Xylanimonas oleitrophica]